MTAPHITEAIEPTEVDFKTVEPTILGVQALSAEYRSRAAHLRARNALHDAATTEREWRLQADVYCEVAARLDGLLQEPVAP